ncbi:flavodoxin family protein [Streptomyces sp. NPDC021212]|uniref:flavodoxin family protein n=1 Tax=Streptomyces sp. NPDC021212 TaxID=3365118 RepID=UPI0037B4EA09
MSPRIAVVHHSRRGTMRALATLAAEGARARGAAVRLLRVAEDGPDAMAWPERVAEPGDVLWADGLVLATPTYFGNVSAAFKQFLETTSPLWRQGLLADRVVTGMTASTCTHAGREATLLALYQTAFHWGSWVLGADPADPLFGSAGGNPYGVSADSRPEVAGADTRGAALSLGHRLADITARVRPSAARPVGSTASGPVNVTVVHCADDGRARLMARECAAGARSVGARVRLRRVASARRGPNAAIVTREDVAWADAVVFGAPARLGCMAAPLLDFVQSLASADGRGPLWGKPASGFVTTALAHTGSESALLAFHHLLLNSGAVVVPPGFTDQAVFEAGGNPYGSCDVRSASAVPTGAALAAVAYQGQRAAMAGDLLRRPATAPSPIPGERAGSDENTGTLEGLRDDHAAI